MPQKGFTTLSIILVLFIFLIIVVLTHASGPILNKLIQNKLPGGGVQTRDYEEIYQENLKRSASKSGQIANPASENCIDKGGQIVIKTRGDGGEYGVCEFEDNQSCEEWALFRGQCPNGGIKTIGFDNDAQVYCAILGGKTLAIDNAKCSLPNGHICLDEDLFNGRCQ